MSDKNLKVAVAGTGYWGKNLVKNFLRLGALKTVFDQNPQAAESVLPPDAGIRPASSFEEILNDPEVAGVVLATPAETHFVLTRQALMAGKNVFVEKPLALSSLEGQELVELADRLGLTFMVDHLLQNHPAYVKLRSLVSEGALGRIRHLYSRRLSFGKIRTQEDVLWSFAPHDFSMILGLMGASPKKVAAHGGAWLTPGLADQAEVSLDFGGGVTAQVSVSWLNPVKEHRLVVMAEEYTAVFDDTRSWDEKLVLYPHRIAWPGQIPEAKPGQAEPIPLVEGEPLAAQCQDFLSAMAGGSKPRTDGAEALRVLQVLEAASTSMKKKGVWQPLQNGNKKYYVHPTAVIDTDVTIGKGCKIWHFSHLLNGTELGENCQVGQNVVLGPKVKIGSGVKIQNNVSVYEGVTLEDDVFCGPSMVFTNVINPRSAIARKHEYRPTLVQQGASIGANATVVCGHTLGAWCFIGAGAVVTSDVPAQALMLGNPARQQGWMCRCGLRLPSDLHCPECGLSYRQDGSYGLRVK